MYVSWSVRVVSFLLICSCLGSRSARLLLLRSGDGCVPAEALKFHGSVGPFQVPAPCHVLWFVSELCCFGCVHHRAPVFVWTDIFFVVATVAVCTLVASICTLVTAALRPRLPVGSMSWALCSLTFMTEALIHVVGYLFQGVSVSWMVSPCLHLVGLCVVVSSMRLRCSSRDGSDVAWVTGPVGFDGSTL